MTVDLTSVMLLLALQILALGWRVAREIDGRERHPHPWVPVPDNVNVVAMLALLGFCVVVPLTTTGPRLYAVGVLARATFAAAAVLIVAHPLVVAVHYGLWSGRAGAERVEPRYCTVREAVVQLVALLVAGWAFVAVLRAASTPTVVLPG